MKTVQASARFCSGCLAKPNDDSTPWHPCQFNPVCEVNTKTGVRTDLGCKREATQRYTFVYPRGGTAVAWFCDEHYEALVNTIKLAKLAQGGVR
jgi:hypothetical protein